MSILKILGKVAKGAIKETIGINLDQFKKGKTLASKSEQKTHEIAVLITQLVVTCISLYKLVLPWFSKKSIEKEKQ